MGERLVAMSTAEEILKLHDEKGAEVAVLKGKKEDFKPALAELLALKAKYKELTGQDVPKPLSDKKKKAAADAAAKPKKEKAEGPSKCAVVCSHYAAGDCGRCYSNIPQGVDKPSCL